MILIVDDNKTIRLSLSVLLKHAGYEAEAVATPDEALVAARTRPDLQLAVIDMNFSDTTSGEEGLELLQRLKVLRPEVPVILITGWGSIPLAVEGMRLGAFDFITKPWQNRMFLNRVETALQLAGTPASAPDSEGFNRVDIVGNDPALDSVLRTAARVSASDAPVLILGENGTGKELVARAIHRNSRRASGPFVMVNLGGISRSLFESEMFGHVKGAFTGAVADRIGRFEMADKGTIFLDEIGDLDPTSQVKLLRVLQQHTFERLGDSKTRTSDFRIIAATNADLGAKVAEGTFREDLLYRINLITLHLPPLRKRPADIEPLAKHFIADYAAQCNRTAPTLSPDAVAFLQSQPFPGNVRQLRNLVERTLLISTSTRLTTEDFRTAIALGSEQPEATPGTSDTTASTPVNLEASEKAAIAAALRKVDGNVTHAAALLGITRQALYRKIKKHNL